MKNSCDVIRDLLPLYADDACSTDSRRLVDEHLAECPDCSGMLKRLQNNEIESDLQMEKQDVIEYGVKRFKRRSATVGSTVSGVFMIPILVCLIINLTTGSAMGWFFIVLAALAVAASLIIVPIMAPKGSKALWMLATFTASLMILLAVTCLVSGGNWFWVASSSVLFGLAVCFLPFVVRAKQLQKWIGKSNKVLLVLVADAVLFLNMMNVIRIHNSGGPGFFTIVGVAAGIALVVLGIMKNRGNLK